MIETRLPCQGADFVLTGAGALAKVFDQPDQYTVLLSYEKLVKTIASITANVPPALLVTLKKRYRADKAAVAVERFKAFWLDQLAQLDIPVYWHVFGGADLDALGRRRLIDDVAEVLRDVQQEFATPHLRDKAITQIKDYCDARASHGMGLAEMESFRFAWGSCYGGL